MNRPEQDKVRLLVIGGFLGAGKTTALLRLANLYHGEGRRVGLITNDQAEDLVDTGTLRVRGFRVEEVAGACFCCKFDELAQAAERIREEERPDVLLGEPVGSCTDLAATVVAPFRRLYCDRYRLAPYSVLVDPRRARQIILEKGFGGFSPKVAYIFCKQLEEADVIGLNKADLLRDAQRTELLDALRREFPRARVLAVSGLTGAGFEEWRALLEQDGPAGVNVAEVDYDVYAEGEAELGWLNMALELQAAAPFDADRTAMAVLERMRARLTAEGREVAHLKVLLGGDGEPSVANCVGGDSPARLSKARGAPLQGGLMVINARVHADPARLHALAEEALAAELAGSGVRASVRSQAHFRPGRPVPTHRFTADEARAQ